MGKILSYSFLIKTFIYFFLVGQIWSSTVNYCFWVVDSEKELIELSNSEENESEEENEKKEKENKNRVHSLTINKNTPIFSLNSFSAENFISIHHPDITTPPPKS